MSITRPISAIKTDMVATRDAVQAVMGAAAAAGRDLDTDDLDKIGAGRSDFERLDREARAAMARTAVVDKMTARIDQI